MRLENRKHIRYADGRPQVQDGDILLWRPTGLAGRIVAMGCRSKYSHVGMAAWSFGILEQVETLQWHGARSVRLSHMVNRWPGACDVYRPAWPSPRSKYDAVHEMKSRGGDIYGWVDFALVALVQLGAKVRWLPEINDDTPLVCSSLVAQACKCGGVIPPKHPLLCAPGDLGEPWAAYQFTLGA